MNDLNHVAIIMDGNGRWAKKRLLPRALGHKAGAKAIPDIIETCLKNKITFLSVFAFSTENWNRSKTEIKSLMLLFSQYLNGKDVERLHKKNIKIIFSGSKQNLSERLLKSITKVELLTRDNLKMTLNIAINYGGRLEIVDAINKILKSNIKTITEESFQDYLYHPEIPDPDLLIRTGGEYRISNFLIWQIAYSEIYTTNTLWPDFSKEIFQNAIDEYKNRNRRFGGRNAK